MSRQFTGRLNQTAAAGWSQQPRQQQHTGPTGNPQDPAAAAAAAAQITNTGLLNGWAQQGPAGQQPPAGQQGAGQQSTGTTGETFEQAIARMEAENQRRIDQAVNTIAQRLTAATHQQPPANNGGGSNSNGGGGQQQQPPTATGPNPADLREARAVYREAVTDGGFAFLGPDERELAGTLAGAAITAAIAAGGDPDTAGAAAARSVREQIGRIRTQYETATLAALQQRGVNVGVVAGQVAAGAGQQLGSGANGGTQGRDAGSQQQAGADRAARRHPRQQ